MAEPTTAGHPRPGNVPRSGTALPPIAMALLLIGAGSTSAQAQSFPEPPPFSAPAGSTDAGRATADAGAFGRLPGPHALRTPGPGADQADARVEVIDAGVGDIESGAVYRLWGIDRRRPGAIPPCASALAAGPWPARWFRERHPGKWVSCTVLATAEGASAVRCSSSTYPDLALAMVREGGRSGRAR